MTPVEPMHLTTADGRTLEVLLYGAEDGFPLVYHTGSPTAAVSFPLLDRVAAGSGLRVIAYSRPGYGESSPRPGAVIADDVADVVTILDRLEVRDFVTLGWSGGGPRALGCAALLPSRCRAATVLAGVAPFDASGLDFLAGMGNENVEEFSAALKGRAALEAWVHMASEGMFDLTGEQVADALGDLAPAVDRTALTGELAEHLAASFRHAGHQGIDGWLDDDLMFLRPWGFEVDVIQVPVAVWQGRQDRMVPYGHGVWLSEHVPGARAHLFDEEGHISLVVQLDRILADLRQLGGVDPAGSEA